MNRNIVWGMIAIAILGTGIYFVYANDRMNSATEENGNTIMPMNSWTGAEPGRSVHDLTIEPAAVAARKDLAQKLSIDEKNIVILLVKENEWTDGCLGLGGPAESCLLALVPGFHIEMQVNGKIYIYRTDKTGQQVRENVGAQSNTLDVTL